MRSGTLLGQFLRVFLPTPTAICVMIVYENVMKSGTN